MAARNALTVVRPEQRDDQRIAVLAVVIEGGEEAEGPILPKGSKAPRGTVDAGRAVSLPNVQPLTYVMYRCNRYGVYLRWLDRGVMREQKPKQVRSIMGRILDGNVQRIGTPGGVDVCPVDADEARETGRCIYALPLELRMAIFEEHVVGGTQQQKADHLHIDRTTLWRRCEKAYPMLLELMNLAAAGLPLEPP